MEKLGINPVLIITQMINFLIVFFLLKKLVYGPILAMLDKRREKVIATDELQAKLTEERGNISKEKEEVIKSAQEEAQVIMTRALESADKSAVQIKKDASKQAQDIISEAKVQMVAEEKKMRQELRNQVANVALATSEAVLRETLTSEQQTRITAEAVKRFNADE